MKVAEGKLFPRGESGNYDDLTRKPKLNGVELKGDVSLDQVGIRAIPLAEIEKMFEGW